MSCDKSPILYRIIGSDYSRSQLEQTTILKEIAVEDIWGIGKQYSKWLQTNCMNDGLKLKNTPEWIVKSKMGIVDIRLLRELNGISCLLLEMSPSPNKATCVSRLFFSSCDQLVRIKRSDRKSRLKLKNELINRWQSPFNKENWQRWG